MTDGNKVVTTTKTNFSGSFFEPLLQLTDCPPHMNYVGVLPVRVNMRFITVVGSRSHSTYAKQALEHIISGLSGHPVCIISGLALGIDGLAHRLAMQHGIPTVAVPGSGLSHNVLYPATHRSLAGQIMQHSGALVSEFDSTQGAMQWTFPKRNRLMARLADLVLVVEAGEKSGTLITARNALEYNVDVGVVPNTIFADGARGSNQLIKDGARPILSVNDVLELLGIDYSAKQPREYIDVTENEMAVLHALVGPLSRDELLEHTDLEPQQLSQTLSLLEIKGYISETLGKIVKT